MATLGCSHESLFLVEAPERIKKQTLDYSPISVYHTPVFPPIPFRNFWPCVLHLLFVTKASVPSEFAPWSQLPFSLPACSPSLPVLKGGHRGCDWLALRMGGGKANDSRSSGGPHAPPRAAHWRGSPRSFPFIRLQTPRGFVADVSLIFSLAARRHPTFRGPRNLCFSMTACLGRASSSGLANWNSFLGLLPLGALCLPSSSGSCLTGEGCFGGYPGAVPGGAGKAFNTASQFPGWPCRPGCSSSPVGFGR